MTRNRDLRRTNFRKCIDEEVLTSVRTIITLLGNNLSKLNDPASMTYLLFQIIIPLSTVFFQNHLTILLSSEKTIRDIVERILSTSDRNCTLDIVCPHHFCTRGNSWVNIPMVLASLYTAQQYNFLLRYILVPIMPHSIIKWKSRG